MILDSNVGRLGKGRLALDTGVSEVRAYVEELDALANEPVPVIELVADVNRRAPALHEGFQITLVPRQLKFSEGHAGCSSCSVAAQDSVDAEFDA